MRGVLDGKAEQRTLFISIRLLGKKKDTGPRQTDIQMPLPGACMRPILNLTQDQLIANLE